jgi:hypothetical protein
VIRDAILHLLNEQPLLVDLSALPSAGDTCVVCTNVRLTSGRRPAWVGRGDNWFVFPLLQVRFLEAPGEGHAGLPAAASSAALETPGDAEIDLDEDLLRRIRES